MDSPPLSIVARAATRAAARKAVAGLGTGWAEHPIDLVADAAQKWPDRLAVVERGRQLTYRDLDRCVEAAAHRLAALGGTQGKPVLLVVQNDIASVIGIHAAIRAGALLLVAPISAGPAQLSAIVAQAKPVAALVPEVTLVGEALPDDGPGWRPLEPLGIGVPTHGATAVNRMPAAEPSVVIYTSGTTSRPKGVIHSVGTLLTASRNYIECAELHDDDRLFVISPLASITGLLQSITVPVMLGARVILETKWAPAATCDLLLESGGTFFGGPDLLLNRLLDEVEARGQTRTTIGAVYLGGTMLDPRILHRIEVQFGIVVMRAYGSSEAPISSAGRRSEPRAVRLADDGAALTGVEVRRGSANDPAECCITGPHLFLGYVDEADDVHAFETDADKRDWFCTGDVADLANGRVKVIGRIRDIVIRKGLKVPISEVESFLNRVPGVARSAGYAAADSETGERLAVAVLPAAGTTIDFDAVIARLRAEGLATWKLPEEIVLWDEPFPENATGKVLRNRLEAESVGRPRLVAQRLRGEDR